jgi:hypothetical protein
VGDDGEHGILSFAVGHAVGGVDAAGGGVEEWCGVGRRVRVDLVGDGEEPEEAIDASVCGEGEVDEAKVSVIEKLEGVVISRIAGRRASRARRGARSGAPVAAPP